MGESLEARLLLLLSKNILDPEKGDLPGFFRENAVDWKRFKDIAVFHELAPFFYSELKDVAASIPADLLESLRRAYYHTIARSQRLWQGFLTLAEVFREKSLSMVPIKGMAGLADIYRDKPFRAMVDVDILIREEEIEAVKEVLSGLGYTSELGGLREKYWLEKHCELTFQKENTPPLDVHFGLDFKRSKKRVLPHLWERVRTVSIDDRKLRLLSPEDQLFSLALHERRFGGKMFCLKNVLDLAMILKQYGGGFDWDYVLREARDGKMRATVFFILLQAEIFFEAAVPDLVWERLTISGAKRKAMMKLVKDHTFDLASADQGKALFLKSHFLLFDGLWEPVGYILNIPLEQFAKYYDLEPYSKGTRFLYHFRFLYLPYRYLFRRKLSPS